MVPLLSNVRGRPLEPLEDLLPLLVTCRLPLLPLVVSPSEEEGPKVGSSRRPLPMPTSAAGSTSTDQSASLVVRDATSQGGCPLGVSWTAGTCQEGAAPGCTSSGMHGSGMVAGSCPEATVSHLVKEGSLPLGTLLKMAPGASPHADPEAACACKNRWPPYMCDRQLHCWEVPM
jgi:hypothetical protein